MGKKELSFVVASYPKHPDIIFKECITRYAGSKPILEDELFEAIRKIGEDKGKNYTLVIYVGKHTPEEIQDIKEHIGSIY